MSHQRFQLLKQYAAKQLGIAVDYLVQDGVFIIESERRSQRELSHSYIRVLYWIHFLQGATVISVPPGFREIVEHCLKGKSGMKQFPNEDRITELIKNINTLLEKNGRPLIEEKLDNEVFACDRLSLKEIEFNDNSGTLKRIQNTDFEYAKDIWPPNHCLPDGVIYGIIKNEKVISVAYAHQTGIMENLVADIAVVTSKDYRRKGYAKAVLQAVMKHFVNKEGEAWYGCSPQNIASQATAQTAGYIPFAKSLILATGEIK